MFFEPVAELTRDHCREHLTAYLAEISAQYSDKVTLQQPKAFDVSNIVGGRVGISGRESLPSLSVGASSKQVTDMGGDLYTYLYFGQFLGMVAGKNALEVERTCERYGAAIELYVMRHRFKPIPTGTNEALLPFMIQELFFRQTTFFGASNITDNDKKIDYWVDGFKVDVGWVVSEAGPGQHQ